MKHEAQWMNQSQRRQKRRKRKVDTSTIKENNSGTIRVNFEGLIALEDLTPVGAFGGIQHRANDESSVVRKTEVSDGAIALRPQLMRWQNSYTALLHHKPRINKHQQQRKQSHSHESFHGLCCEEENREQRRRKNRGRRMRVKEDFVTVLVLTVESFIYIY